MFCRLRVVLIALTLSLMGKEEISGTLQVRRDNEKLPDDGTAEQVEQEPARGRVGNHTGGPIA